MKHSFYASFRRLHSCPVYIQQAELAELVFASAH